jgi:hypothetical protein
MGVVAGKPPPERVADERRERRASRDVAVGEASAETRADAERREIAAGDELGGKTSAAAVEPHRDVGAAVCREIDERLLPSAIVLKVGI